MTTLCNFCRFLLFVCVVFAGCQRPLTIEGVIKNSEGEPLPGVEVDIFSESGVLDSKDRRTNAKGEFKADVTHGGRTFVLEIQSGSEVYRKTFQSEYPVTKVSITLSED